MDISISIWTHKEDLRRSQAQQEDVHALRAGEVRLKIDRFALTSNNVTYAVFGEAMNYWRFFPAKDSAWGRIPAWGFGDVVESAQDQVKLGRRFFGFYPMADQVVVRPNQIDAFGFSDGTPHRQLMSEIYNRYLDSAEDPLHTRESEDLQMLFRPLFTTSWLIVDFLDDAGFFGADTVIITSASSKTSIGLAWTLHNSPRDPVRVVGLTSKANREFVEALGIYDSVLGYDDLDALPRAGKAVLVDMAGSHVVRLGVHTRLGDRLVHSCAVGAAHWDSIRGDDKIPGPKPTLFFAPAQAQRRAQDWGAAELQRRLARDWEALLPFVASRLDVRTAVGADATLGVLSDLVEGHTKPDVGHILSLSQAP